MPDVYGPFVTATWGQGPWFRDAYARSVSGVFGTAFGTSTAGDLALTVSGLTATMALGRAHVRGAGYERTGTAWSQTLATNTNANPRIDRLVLRRDLAVQTVVPLWLQGTPAVSPAIPPLTQVEDGIWDLPLHNVRVPGGSGTTLTNIVDERVPANPGGLLYDSGWIAITPAAGFSGGNSFAIRRIGPHVSMRGNFARLAGNFTTTAETVFSLPASTFRPSVPGRIFLAGFASASANGLIMFLSDTADTVTVAGVGASTTTGYVDGATWTTA